MAWGIIGINQNSSVSTTAQVTMIASKIDVGQLIWLGIGIRNSGTATVSSVVDDRGNTWARRHRHAAAGQVSEQWTAICAVDDTTAITVTLSTSVSTELVCAGISGTPASWSVAVTAQAATTGTSHSCGSAAAQAGDLMITHSSSLGSFNATANADYTELILGARSYSQWKEPGGSFASDGAFATAASEDMTSTQIVIRPAGGGGATVGPHYYYQQLRRRQQSRGAWRDGIVGPSILARAA